MQHTINLASDTASDAPTHKRSKLSENDLDDIEIRDRPSTEMKSEHPGIV